MCSGLRRTKVYEFGRIYLHLICSDIIETSELRGEIEIDTSLEKFNLSSMVVDRISILCYLYLYSSKNSQRTAHVAFCICCQGYTLIVIKCRT